MSRGHVRERRPGVWAVIIEADHTPGEKRQQQWFTVYGTRKDAERERTRLLREADTIGLSRRTGLTVGQLLERWLEAKGPEVKRTSHELYERIIARHLQPRFGRVPLEKLTPLHVEQYYAAKRREKPRPLSGTTLANHHVILAGACARAVNWGLLVVNPLDRVTPPRKDDSPARALTEAETAALLRVAEAARLQDPRLHVAILLGVTLGVREGEILGLRWSDLVLAPERDPPAGVLTVARTLVRTKEGLAFQAPKSRRKGERTLPLPSLLVPILAGYRRWQGELARQLGPAWHGEDLVCPALTGVPWHPSSLYYRYRVLLKEHGLPLIRFHDLRHTHATAILLHHPLHVVADRLGHASRSITANLYAHVLSGDQEAVSAGVDARLRAVLEPERISPENM